MKAKTNIWSRNIFFIVSNITLILRSYCIMKYVLAIDSFKGCLSSKEAEAAVEKGIRRTNPNAEVVSIPVSDGGEGMMDAFSGALSAEIKTIRCHDPLMRWIDARYAVSGKTAIIEIAQTCGLSLIESEQHNPLVTTTYGLGDMLFDALAQGYTDFIIGLGGSGTSDCGIGMLRCLTDRVREILQQPSIHWKEVKDWLYSQSSLSELHFTLACDVRNPLYGPQGAAEVFARQKGADDNMIKMLERRAFTFAEASARYFGFDYSKNKGAGAAGGLGYAFMQYFHAKMESGADLLLDILRFEELSKDADFVITGEGKADRQTLMGKLPSVILRRSKCPVLLLAGQIEDAHALLHAGFYNVLNINPLNANIEESVKPEVAKQNLTRCTTKIVGC